jgi:hypothetical protein
MKQRNQVVPAGRFFDRFWLSRGHSDVEISVEKAQRLLTDFTRASLGTELVEKLAGQLQFRSVLLT